jgi:hypothetical protein
MRLDQLAQLTSLGNSVVEPGDQLASGVQSLLALQFAVTFLTPGAERLVEHLQLIGTNWLLALWEQVHKPVVLGAQAYLPRTVGRRIRLLPLMSCCAKSGIAR